jgi:hypothetical protein
MEIQVYCLKAILTVYTATPVPLWWGSDILGLRPLVGPLSTRRMIDKWIWNTDGMTTDKINLVAGSSLVFESGPEDLLLWMAFLTFSHKGQKSRYLPSPSKYLNTHRS